MYEIRRTKYRFEVWVLCSGVEWKEYSSFATESEAQKFIDEKSKRAE